MIFLRPLAVVESKRSSLALQPKKADILANPLYISAIERDKNLLKRKLQDELAKLGLDAVPEDQLDELVKRIVNANYGIPDINDEITFAEENENGEATGRKIKISKNGVEVIIPGQPTQKFEFAEGVEFGNSRLEALEINVDGERLKIGELFIRHELINKGWEDVILGQSRPIDFEHGFIIIRDNGDLSIVHASSKEIVIRKGGLMAGKKVGNPQFDKGEIVLTGHTHGVIGVLEYSEPDLEKEALRYVGLGPFHNMLIGFDSRDFTFNVRKPQVIANQAYSLLQYIAMRYVLGIKHAETNI